MQSCQAQAKAHHEVLFEAIAQKLIQQIFAGHQHNQLRHIDVRWRCDVAGNGESQRG